MKYQIDSKHKIIDISEIDLKPYNKQNLIDSLKKIIVKFPYYSIIFPMFHKKEKEYSLNLKVLPKLKFKLMSKRPIFIKSVKKQNGNYVLSFKTLKDVKSEKLFKNIFSKSINASLITEYSSALNLSKSFNNYVINKEVSIFDFRE